MKFTLSLKLGLVPLGFFVCHHQCATDRPGVVDLVAGRIISRRPLSPLGRGLQLPVVDLVQEHLGQLNDGLPLTRGQMAELVLHKVIHPLWTNRKTRAASTTLSVSANAYLYNISSPLKTRSPKKSSGNFS